MTTVWFTADLHLSHRLVAELRGYDDVEAHDAAVFAGLDTLAPGDTLWILGDISSGSARGQRAALGQLHATLAAEGVTAHLIAGNHDSIHPLHRDALKWDPLYRYAFTSVQPFARRRINGHNVWLSHFPWRGAGDHTDDERHPTVRLGDDGTSWLLHGHTHSPDRIDRARRMIHVGLDSWDLRPVPIHTIAHLIGDRP